MTEQTVETPAPTEDEAMSALYDKLTASGVTEDPPQQETATDGLQQEAQAEEVTDEAQPAGEQEPEAPAEGAEGKPEAPTDLPASIRAKWADMPEEAREAVLTSHRDLTRKMADQGRVVQASKPVYDVLVRAAQEIPTLADMTPAQIAADVFKMAQIQGQLNADPVGTLLGIARQYGALDAMKAAMEKPGQPTPPVQARPEDIERIVSRTLTARETERMVMEYAAQREHWSSVEGVIPQMIPIAQQRLGEGASPKDVLDAAYDMAIHAIPDLRAKVAAPVSTQAQPDPARTAAQLKAKSVNVKSSSPAKPRPQSEEERMAAVWDKYRN